MMRWETMLTVEDCLQEHYYWRVAIPPQRRLQTIQDSSAYLMLCWYLREGWQRVRARLIAWAIVPNADGQVVGTEARVDCWVL